MNGASETPRGAEEVRTYRDPFRWVLLALCIAGAAAVVVPSVADPVGGLAWAAVWITLGAADVWLGLRVVRARVTTDGEGIHISNVFATRAYRWDDIDAFTVGRWKLQASTGIVKLKDGTRFGMLAVPVVRPVMLPQPVDAEAKLDELKQLLEAHGTTARGREARSAQPAGMSPEPDTSFHGKRDDRPFGAVFMFEGLDLAVAPDVGDAEGYIEPYDADVGEIYDERGRRLQAHVIGDAWPKRISISIVDPEPHLPVVIDRVREFLERTGRPIPAAGDPAAWMHDAAVTLQFRRPSGRVQQRVRSRLRRLR